jgi:pimeloyl-ACP methyl ester carboxylesterase
MPSASVNSTTLHYIESGSGPNVVLVHGFPLDARVWEKQVAAFSDRYRVITPDLRGFGKSPSNVPFTIESLADDVHALLEEIGARPCVLGGISMGGYVALAHVRKYPTDLRGLMLFDTRAEGDTPEGRQNRMKMIELVRSAGAVAIADQMLPKLISDYTSTHAPEVGHQLRRSIESCPPRTIEHGLLALRDRPDHSEFLPSISFPTLIVVGEHDALTPPVLSQRMCDLIPSSELRTIASAGHLSPMEQAQAVNGHIRRFLDALDAR